MSNKASFRQSHAHIPGLEKTTIGDFWSWAYSDIFMNSNRGVFAEFLVGTALGALIQPRVEWDGKDLVYRDVNIEIKSSAYRQRWHDKEHKTSGPQFTIATRYAWNAEIDRSSNEPIHDSSCFVFCLYANQDLETGSKYVIDPAYWEFYAVLTRNLPDQKKINLGRLRQLCADLGIGGPIQFDEIKPTVDVLIDSL